MGDPVVICTKSLCDGWFEERVTFDVSDGRALLMRQERQLRSEMDPSLTTLNVWETDPDAGVSIPREALANLALALLPHLTGDELRRVAEAMPRVAGEWEHRERWGSRLCMFDDAEAAGWEHFENGYQALEAYASGWTEEAPYQAVTYVGGTVVTWHPTARAAQAACDARLKAAGVRLCGEVIR